MTLIVRELNIKAPALNMDETSSWTQVHVSSLFLSTAQCV